MPHYLSALIYLSALDIDLVSSSDDRCKLPQYSRETNKYSKIETHHKNKKNDTDVGKIHSQFTEHHFVQPKKFLVFAKC